MKLIVKFRLFNIMAVTAIVVLLTSCSSLSSESSSLSSSREGVAGIQEQIQTTDLYNDCFIGLADKIGKYTFAECKDYVIEKGYNALITQPDEKTTGRIRIEDNNNFYLEIQSYPNYSDVEMLAILLYSTCDNSYQGRIHNLFNSPIKKYTLFDIDGENRDMEVSSLEEITEFVFTVAPEKYVAYQEKKEKAERINVTMDLACTYNGGYPIFNLTTNLPNGTEILLTFSDGNSVAQEHVFIQNGQASNSPFSLNGTLVGKGAYKLGVGMIVPEMQSYEVRSVIGNKGEWLTGDLIIQSARLGNYVSLHYNIEIKADGSISISAPTISD